MPNSQYRDFTIYKQINFINNSHLFFILYEKHACSFYILLLVAGRFHSIFYAREEHEKTAFYLILQAKAVRRSFPWCTHGKTAALHTYPAILVHKNNIFKILVK